MFLFLYNLFFYPFPILVLILTFPISWSFYLPESNPIFAFSNQHREVHLYTENHRHGLYLQINLDGRVTGSDAQTPYSVLQLKSVKQGHVVIKGHSSSMFLCMDSMGNLRGQRAYEEADCSFRELLLADGYTRFLNSHNGIPLSLAARNSPDRHSVPFTRFLPLRNTLPMENVSEESTKAQRNFNIDSEDLFGIGQDTMVSPQQFMDK
ncbi:PREDICTED: fibroblast growth factor 21-like [Cyprinodon variegatus]|uniref:fibroblast growth factor 21-like n=1 Tax=Cyprinodon variegatus TaxID=28743 RepID=UPI000742AF68|nr:PREDICTED: fibroblast growth factor 21-like [Cyprinodon variegatus]